MPSAERVRTTPEGSELTLTQLTSLEVATSSLFGLEGPEIELDLTDELTPLAALERSILPALERPPCLVSFSGGRDSSVLLAAAARVAERESLDPPIASTLRFPDAPSTEESEWQELVIGHVGIDEWERVELADADVLGTAARSTLRRHGVLYPASLYITDAAIEAARGGGSFISGFAGDQLFGTWRWLSLADPLARRRRPRPYDALRAGYVALPSRFRAPRERRRAADLIPSWLRPSARAEVLDRWAERAAQEPAWWRNRVRWRARRRDLHVHRSNMQMLGSERDVNVLVPFMESPFVSALARAGGRYGYGDRNETMSAAFPGLLPDRVLRRTTKATGEDLFWGGRTADFLRDWDGRAGVPDPVDPEALTAEWRSPAPDGRSALLLQSAWLHADRDSLAA